jgi:hypothetical protein
MRMSVSNFYRLCIWLPILVPLAMIGVFRLVGRPLAVGIFPEVLAYSLVYGGPLYAVLAAWATWWIGERPEAEIRRLMFRAPVVMTAVFVPLVLAAGFIVGAPGPFAGVAALGALVILSLGYAYVGVTLLLRRLL